MHALAIDVRNELQVTGVCADGTVLVYQAGPMRSPPRSADVLGTGTTLLNDCRSLLLRAYCPAVQPATCIAASSPPANDSPAAATASYVPMVALGTANGSVQLVDPVHCTVHMQVSTCSGPISDLAWIDPERIVVASRLELDGQAQ